MSFFAKDFDSSCHVYAAKWKKQSLLGKAIFGPACKERFQLAQIN